jgi:hypothetical protein
LEVSDAIEYAKFRSRSHDAVIRVYDAAGNVIETNEHVSSKSRSGKIADLPGETLPEKSRQLFLRAHNETLPVVAMRIRVTAQRNSLG